MVVCGIKTVVMYCYNCSDLLVAIVTETFDCLMNLLCQGSSTGAVSARMCSSQAIISLGLRKLEICIEADS